MNQRDDTIFAPDFSEQPYWWRSAPPNEQAPADLPAICDVAVVGSGFGGASAALTLARAGHSVVVFDAGAPGSGACSRNMGGLVGRVEGLRPQPGTTLFGRPIEEFEAEGTAAAQFVLDLIAAEGIDCHLRTDGQVVFATNAKALAVLSARAARRKATDPSCEDHVIDRSEIGTEAAGTFQARYVGALVSPRQRSLHPGMLVNGLIEAARGAGASFHGQTRVTGISAAPGGQFEVRTARGAVRARRVVVTTAGYSDAAVPVMKRRVFPFGAHVIATEPLDPALFARIIPHRRMLSNTRHHWMVLAPAPDEPRLLVSGGYLCPPNPRGVATELRSELVACFPELSSVRVANAWFGFMPISRGFLPKISCIDGVYYSTATNWSMAAFLGHKLALRILERPGGESVFDHVPFPEFPALLQPPTRARVPFRLAFSLLDRLGVASAK